MKYEKLDDAVNPHVVLGLGNYDLHEWRKECFGSDLRLHGKRTFSRIMLLIAKGNKNSYIVFCPPSCIGCCWSFHYSISQLIGMVWFYFSCDSFVVYHASLCKSGSMAGGTDLCVCGNAWSYFADFR